MALDPDTFTRIALIGTTERLHNEKADRDEAIAEVQRIAAGRTDLLASAAGHFLGMDAFNSVACYQLLVDAGADLSLVDAATDWTRANLSRGGHTTAGTASPRRA